MNILDENVLELQKQLLQKYGISSGRLAMI